MQRPAWSIIPKSGKMRAFLSSVHQSLKERSESCRAEHSESWNTCDWPLFVGYVYLYAFSHKERLLEIKGWSSKRTGKRGIKYQRRGVWAKHRRTPRNERRKLQRGQRRTITERMRTMSLRKMAAEPFSHSMDVALDPVKAEIRVPNKFR